MLGLKVDAPLYREVELLSALLENLNRFRIGHASELIGNNIPQAVKKTLVHKLVEEGHLLRAALQNRVDDVLHHRLSGVHIIIQIREGHLRFDHPELRRMPRGIGYLSAEGGPEGIDVTESHGKVLGVQLAGNREVRGLAEEILAVVDTSVFLKRKIVQVKRRNPEHFAGAFGV